MISDARTDQPTQPTKQPTNQPGEAIDNKEHLGNDDTVMRVDRANSTFSQESTDQPTQQTDQQRSAKEKVDNKVSFGDGGTVSKRVKATQQRIKIPVGRDVHNLP